MTFSLKSFVDVDLDHEHRTYLMGRVGGSVYICIIVPVTDNSNFIGFNVISRTEHDERKIWLSLADLSNISIFEIEMNSLPHGNDILNYLIGKSDNPYECHVSSELETLQCLRQWRKVN